MERTRPCPKTVALARARWKQWNRHKPSRHRLGLKMSRRQGVRRSPSRRLQFTRVDADVWRGRPPDSSTKARGIPGPLRGRYDQAVDRESAYEKLKAKNNPVSAMGEPLSRPATTRSGSAPHSTGNELFEVAAKSVLRAVGSSLGRSIVRGPLGSILKR